MGLFKLFKKQPENVGMESNEDVEVRFDNLIDWLKTSNSEKISSMMAGLSNLWADFQGELSVLQAAIRALEKVEFEPEDKTYAVINMTKDMFTKKSQLLGKVPKHLGQEFSDARTAYSEALQIISGIKEANAKQAYIISNYFKREADQIIKSMKNIDQILGAFKEKMDSEGSILFLIDDLSKEMPEYRDFSARLNDIGKAELEMSMEINRGNSELDSRKAMLGKIKSGKSWEELQQVKNDLETISSEIVKAAYGFSEVISEIKRPVKKIIHEHGILGLTKEQVKILSSDIGIEEAGKVDSVLAILENCLSKNKTALKAAEIEKINSFRANVASGEFKRKREIYDTLLGKKAFLEEKYKSLAGVEKEKEKIESEIGELDKGIERAKIEAGKLKIEAGKTASEVEAKRSKIASMVSQKIGKQISIAG